MSTTTNSSSSTYTYCSSASTTANGTAALDCYNVIDTSQLITSIWLSAAGGLAILLLFAILRNNSTWRSIYHKRATQISDLVRRPWPFLNRTLVDRCFSFLYPIFATNDAGLFLSAGIDSLMIVRTNLLGVQLFAPLTLVVLPVLLPLYRTGGYLESSETSANADSIMLYTLANIGNKNNKLWAAIVFSPFIMLWALRCVDDRTMPRPHNTHPHAQCSPSKSTLDVCTFITVRSRRSGCCKGCSWIWGWGRHRTGGGPGRCSATDQARRGGRCCTRLAPCASHFAVLALRAQRR